MNVEPLLNSLRLVGARIRALGWRIRGAKVSSKVTIGRRSRVDNPAGVSLSHRVTLEEDVWLKLVDSRAQLEIGEFSFIGRGSEIDAAEHVSIGAHVLIAPRVFITDHTHNIAADQLIGAQGCTSKSVSIGDDVWIGTGVTILPGVTIGEGAVIGAGSVVRKSIPAGEIWAGVPARHIRHR